MGVIYFLAIICGLKSQGSRQNMDFYSCDQLLEISSLELVTNQGREITGGIQSRFVDQSASLNYYELVEDWEVEENTNINMLEKTEENYLQSSEYAEAQMNVLDEVPHQGNLELDQTRYTTKIQDHEYAVLEVTRLEFVHFVKKKDMQSWIVLLCHFTSKQVLLNMRSYKMWQEH